MLLTANVLLGILAAAASAVAIFGDTNHGGVLTRLGRALLVVVLLIVVTNTAKEILADREAKAQEKKRQDEAAVDKAKHEQERRDDQKKIDGLLAGQTKVTEVLTAMADQITSLEKESPAGPLPAPEPIRDAPRPREGVISGRVVDSRRRSLAGVTVVAYAPGQALPVFSTHTKVDGKFEFELSASRPIPDQIDLIFQHPKYDTRVITSIDAVGGFFATVQLFLKGERRPVALLPGDLDRTFPWE